MGWRRPFVRLRELVRPTRNVGSSTPIEPGNSLPRWLMIPTLITAFFQGAQITLPYTLSAYLVRDFKKGSSEQVIGQLTGLLVSSASFVRAFSSFPLGIVSDHVGRKGMILASNTVSTCGLIAFGCSSTYIAALIARILPAMFDAGAVAFKSMLGEACNAAGQARGMVVLSLGWGLGVVVGPGLGVLSQPCDNFGHGFPLCGPGGLFLKRPFLLPCLVTGCFGLLAFLANLIFLEETLPRLRQKRAQRDKDSLTTSLLHGSSGDLNPEETQRTASDAASDASRDLLQGPDSNIGASNTSAPTNERAHLRTNDQSTHRDKGAMGLNDNDSLRAQNEEYAGGPGAQVQQSDDAAPTIAQHGDVEAARQEQGDPSESQPWYKDRKVLLAVTGAALVVFTANFLDELTPIFVSAPTKERGLGMPLEQFTYSVIFGGVVLVLYSIFIFPRYQTAMGPLHTVRMGLLWGLPVALLIPAASLLGGNRIAEEADLFVTMGAKSICRIMTFASSTIIINLVAPPTSLGTVNGASESIMSLARGLGPAACGSAWALTVSLHFPGQQFLAFGFMAAAAAATSFLYLGLELPERRRP